MRVLYANPIFLDYRIPFFKELVKLFNGEFYVLYSSNRYKDRFDELLERIPQESGVISKVCKHILKNQYFIEANCKDIGPNLRLPYPYGIILSAHKIGENCLMGQYVTLGGNNCKCRMESGKKHKYASHW